LKNFNQFESLRIIEALRSGIPSRAAAQAFTQGRQSALGDIENLLTDTYKNDRSNSFSFQAEFGNGKTHLLNMIFNLAWKKNFVVSKVILNKETPMNQPAILYRKAAQNCFLPDHDLPGFDQKLLKMYAKTPSVEELLKYADNNIHPRLKTIFESCLQGEGETWNLLYGDLQGDFLPLRDLKSICELQLHKRIKFPKFRKTDLSDVTQYFKFLTLLFRAMGYAGWIILFDEAELIQRHGPKGRIKAYNVLNHLMSLDERLDFPMMTVFAFASTFEQFMVDKDELKNLKQKSDSEDHQLSEKIGRTMEKLLKIPSLPELNNDDYRNVIEGVIKLHADAFGWKPSVNIEELIRSVTVERRVRTMIRGVIQKLDLLYLDRPSEIVIEAIEETMPSEDESFFSQRDDDEKSDADSDKGYEYIGV
jgi:hypothetical protein